MYSSLLFLSALALFVESKPVAQRRTLWPDGPLRTSGRDIVNSANGTVVYAGVNWPGAADVMIPEGLQYASVGDILSKVKSLDMNVIRLTYAIEMIDDVYDGADSSLKNALITALGQENGTVVLGQILDHNPSFTETTTRLEVFDAIAAEALSQQIYVHLDNHVSKGIWCCSSADGNSWFGDTYFNTTTWIRGLSYMASHAASWPAFVSMSLRNELREPSSDTSPEPYDWETWYKNVVPAADAINAANDAPLIFFSGLNFDTQLGPVVAGTDLGNGSTFLVDDFAYKDKIVFELHNYQNSATSCSSIESALHGQGYSAMDPSSNVTNQAPVVLTEFGFQQSDATAQDVYAQCIVEYLTGLEGGPGGWMQWALSGSYYIRDGTQDFDESWGLLNHDWSDWRSDGVALNYTKAFADATLS